MRTRKQTTLRQRSATSKAQKETNERRNMNNMDSLSFYNDDPVFASPLNNDEFMLLEDDTERDVLLDQEDVFMEDAPPLSTSEPLEIDDVRSPPTAATRGDHIKPSISTWAYVRINPERFVPPPEVAPFLHLYKTTTSLHERKARSSTIPAVIHNTGCRRPFHSHPFMNQPREPGCPTPALPYPYIRL